LWFAVPPPLSSSRSGLEPLLALLGPLLADGVAGTGPELAPALAEARRNLDRAGLRWPVDVLDDLADQLGAYRDRTSRYHPAVAAALVAEAVGRHRCVTGGGATPRSQVLGDEEAAETPLRLVRLTGLGARIHGDATSRTVEVYLADPRSATVLAVRRRVRVGESEDPPTPLDLGRRRTGGVRLDALARGNVVTESAVRSADRLVHLGSHRVARTTVAPSGGDWDALAGGVLVRDLDAEADRLAGRPPTVLRARVVAEDVRAVAVESVAELHFSPAAQQLRAWLHAPAGTVRVVAAYSPEVPGAVDALARALSGAAGPVRFVAGHLRRHSGGLDLAPTVVVVGPEVVVPAFAAAPRAHLAAPPPPTAADPLTAVVTEAVELSADVVHRGVRGLPPSWHQRAERTGAALRRAGLPAAGTAVDGLADAVRAGPADLLDRWADVHLRLVVTAEQV
jgi:hypothetical protein